MPGKPHKCCLICGKLFEIDVLVETGSDAAFFEEIPSKIPSFCPMCEAKIKKEAKDTQKEFKPI